MIHSDFYFFKDFIYSFLERGKGREKEKEMLMCERHINHLPLTRTQLGTWPTTQVCALAGDRTDDLLVRRLTLNPLSHTSQGQFLKEW